MDHENSITAKTEAVQAFDRLAKHKLIYTFLAGNRIA